MGRVLLILFFYPERADCLGKVVNYARSRGGEVRVLEDARLRALVEVEGVEVEDLVESVDCVSRVGLVLSSVPRVDPSELPQLVAKEVANSLRNLIVAVRARRWDKSYPSTSVEIAQSVARALEEAGIRVSPRARDILLLCVGRDRVWIALVRKEWERVLNAVPRSVARRVRAVACMVSTPYEVADLVQLARALGIELVLLKPVERAVSDALKMLGMRSLPPEVRIVDSVDDALQGADVSVLLSRFGRGNEKTLVDLLSDFSGRVALVVGNEFSDPPPNVRDRCGYSVRLGPETGKPMRSCVALAYALGIVFSAMSGFL